MFYALRTPALQKSRNLEVGSAHGITCRILGNRVSRVVGADFDAKMLAAAERPVMVVGSQLAG